MIMKSIGEHADTSGGGRKEPPQPKQIAGALAVAGAITIVWQHASPRSGLFRYFSLYCTGSGKDLLPLGRGAGSPVVYCHEESEAGPTATRKALVENRDPHETSRERAQGNIRPYCLPRKDRFKLSLMTKEGHRAFWSELAPGTRAVFIDSFEGFAKVAGKESADFSPSASAPLSDLLERLIARGIAVVIFAKAQGRKKGPPEWLDGLTCNMVHIEEDTKEPMQGGARLTIHRDPVDELDCTPRRFTWWWKVDDDGNLDCSCREEHFVEAVQPAPSARDVRLKEIKALVAKGITQQKEIAGRLGVNPSTIFHDTEELVRRGEIVKDPKTGALSLPANHAPPSADTDGNSGDETGDDTPDMGKDSSPAAPDMGASEPMPAPKEDREPEDDPW